MDDNKLEVLLFRYKTLIYGEVIKNEFEMIPKVFFNGFTIQQGGYAMLDLNYLFIAHEGEIFHTNFNSEEDAIKTFNNIEKCLDILNGERN